jgi:hypothetical protein
MRKIAWSLVVVLVGFLTASGEAQDTKAPGPSVVVANPLIKMTKDAKAVIIGAGFKPGEEIRVLFVPLDGVITDIGFALQPDPVPNKHGNWVATWSCEDQLEFGGRNSQGR